MGGKSLDHFLARTEMMALATHAESVPSTLTNGGVLVLQGNNAKVGIVQISIRLLIVIGVVGHNAGNLVFAGP